MQYYNLIPKLGEGPTAMAHVVYSGLDKTQRMDSLRGSKIDDVSAAKVELKNVTKKFPDLMGRGSSEFFVTDAFKHIVENMESSQNIHFIPVILRNQQYWLLNLLNNVEAFDRENSTYSAYEGGALKSIQKLAMKEDKIQGRNIFRMAEEPVYIFISKTLKDAIEANNLTGIAYDNIFEIKTT